MTPNCKDCRFFAHLETSPSGRVAGYCRRYPPTVFGDDLQGCPQVDGGFDCGEFQAKEPEPNKEPERHGSGKEASAENCAQLLNTIANVFSMQRRDEDGFKTLALNVFEEGRIHAATEAWRKAK